MSNDVIALSFDGQGRRRLWRAKLCLALSPLALVIADLIAGNCGSWLFVLLALPFVYVPFRIFTKSGEVTHSSLGRSALRVAEFSWVLAIPAIAFNYGASRLLNPPQAISLIPSTITLDPNAMAVAGLDYRYPTTISGASGKVYVQAIQRYSIGSLFPGETADDGQGHTITAILDAPNTVTLRDGSGGYAKVMWDGQKMNLVDSHSGSVSASARGLTPLGIIMGNYGNFAMIMIFMIAYGLLALALGLDGGVAAIDLFFASAVIFVSCIFWRRLILGQYGPGVSPDMRGEVDVSRFIVAAFFFCAGMLDLIIRLFAMRRSATRETRAFPVIPLPKENGG